MTSRRHATAALLLAVLGGGAPVLAKESEVDWAPARERVAPTVVTVKVMDAQGKLADQGSGFFVARDVVATSRHLFRRAAGAKVVMRDRTEHAAGGVRGADPRNDLVLLAVPPVDVVPIEWGDSASLPHASPVAHFGSADGAPATFTHGIYVGKKSALGIVGFLETTAEMRHGLSGAPLFDPRGRLLGIGAARLDWENPSGLSIPVERVKALVALAGRTEEARPFGTAATFLDAAEWAVQGSPEMKAATEADDSGDAAGIVAAMEVVVARYPKSALALYLLGAAQSGVQRDADAVASLRRALALWPEYLEALTELGDALLRLERFDEAATALRDATAIEGRDLTLWFRLGMARLRAEDFHGAVVALERVTKHAPERPEPWAWLGLAYVEVKRFADADAIVARLRPDHPAAAARLAAEIAKRRTK